MVSQSVGIRHLVSKNLRRSYKEFIKDCPEGRLEKDAFLRIYRKVFPFPGDPGEFANRLFAAFDENNSGVIDFREFVCGLSIVSCGTVDEKLKCASRSASCGSLD